MKEIPKLQNKKFKNPLSETIRKNIVSGNILAKKYIASKLKPNQILIMSHTHIPEYNLKEQYVNTGAIEYRHINYVSICEDEIKLNHSQY